MVYLGSMKRTAGISLLLEILVGLGLFGLGMLLTMGLFPGAQAAASQAKNLSLATNLARGVMEQVRGMPYASITSIASTDVPQGVEVNGVQAVQLFSYQVDVDPPPAGRDFKNVVVSVNWNTGGASLGGQVHSYRLQTYVAPY